MSKKKQNKEYADEEALFEKITNKKAKAILEDESMYLSERFFELEYQQNIFKREQFVPKPSPFAIWENEFKEFITQDCQAKGMVVPEFKIEDEFYDLAARNTPRCDDVNYGLLIDKMECAIEGVEPKESFLVLYDRSTKQSWWKTPQEIIDCIYNYCLKNRVWGFKYDW